jgi:hypothetical protein
MFGKMTRFELNKEDGSRRRFLIVAVVVFVIIIASYVAIVYVNPVRNLIFPETVSNKNLEEPVPESNLEADPETEPVAGMETDLGTVPETDSEIAPAIENSVEKPEDFIDYRTEPEIYKEMHEMANTKIVADQVWGEIDITQERVDALISEISLSDFEDKEILLKTLSNWKNNDFSNAVAEHNYLWEKLNGTVGEAYKLK